MKVKEMSIISVNSDEGKTLYVTENYLSKIMDNYYPWIKESKESLMQKRLDRWNQLFGNKR